MKKTELKYLKNAKIVFTNGKTRKCKKILISDYEIKIMNEEGILLRYYGIISMKKIKKIIPQSGISAIIKKTITGEKGKWVATKIDYKKEHITYKNISSGEITTENIFDVNYWKIKGIVK